jgi:hypothetical protein
MKSNAHVPVTNTSRPTLLATALIVFAITICTPLTHAQKTGGGALEPELKDRDDILYFSDFESDTWIEPWDATAQKVNMRIVDPQETGRAEPFSGKALEIKVVEGTHYGSAHQFFFKKHLGYQPEEMYARFYCCYAEDFSGYGGKGPGWGGTAKAGWGGKPADGTNGWSARGGIRTNDDGTLALTYYTYHALMRGQYGDSFVWAGPAAAIQTGRWYCIEEYCKINTPGKSDGILRAWIDDELVYEKTDVRMRETESVVLRSFWVNYYHGGKNKSAKDRHVYIDNMVLATDKRIGPIRSKN